MSEPQPSKNDPTPEERKRRLQLSACSHRLHRDHRDHHGRSHRLLKSKV